MGITKQYLRWIPTEKFGIIGSQLQNNGINFIENYPEIYSKDRICCTAACEDLLFWDLKTGQLIDKINNSNNDNGNFDDSTIKISPISCLKYNSKSNILSSGHQDGTIRLFDLNEFQKSLKILFSGHRGPVSCLTFDSCGLRIASGGKDTEIVIWDVANQSGLFRLKGHKGSINHLEFMKNHPSILLSASSDTFIKFWNLNTQHCFKTLVGHRTEIWKFVLFKNDQRLISGGSDSELKVWKITFSEDYEDNPEQFLEKLEKLKQKQLKKLQLIGDNDVDEDYLDEQNSNDQDSSNDNFLLVENFGTILRKSTERLINLQIDSTEKLLICNGKDKFLECFKIRSDEEILIKIKKRLKKEKKRRIQEEDDDDNDEFINHEDNKNDLELQESTISDEIERLDLIKLSTKICSIDLIQIKNNDLKKFQEFRLICLLSNNSIDFYQLKLINKSSLESNKLTNLSTMGHRNDVRTISISSDNLSIMTASADSIKIWNKSSCRCINTIEDSNLDYPLCSLFVPGDKHVVLGTKSGKIQIISLINIQLQSTIDASELGLPIWSINLLPDLSGIVSGSEDKFIKFWSFDLMIDDNMDMENELNQQNNSKILTLNQERELELEEGIICTKISSNSKFLAVSLLNSCVKIYFCDTFKFFLSLYGHKLPVLCMDISSDNSLIVTGSSDKNIKIWGMDFGDCHRSIFAHDDNILSLVFIPKTHQFFTASKDSTIKIWDADNFEKIQTLYGHHKEIWSMALSSNGKFLVTASHDKSLRLWQKTDEPLVLEEEKELELEREFRKEFETNIESHTIVPGESTTTTNMDDQQESGMAQKKTSETIKSVEKLIESLDIFSVELEKLKLFEQQLTSYEKKIKEIKNGKKDDHQSLDSTIPKPIREPIDPHLMIYKTDCPYRFILEILIRIKSNELEETLLQLPFNYIQKLLKILLELLKRRWELELICRCCCFLLRVNFGQITTTSSQSMSILLNELRIEMKQAIKSLQDLIGINYFGLKYLEQIYEEREEISIFTQTLHENLLKKSKKHKKQQSSAPILTWT